MPWGRICPEFDLDNYQILEKHKNCYLIKNYGVQVVAQAFYVNDTNLINYEDLFKGKKSAFVRMESLLNNNE